MTGNHKLNLLRSKRQFCGDAAGAARSQFDRCAALPKSGRAPMLRFRPKLVFRDGVGLYITQAAWTDQEIDRCGGLAHLLDVAYPECKTTLKSSRASEALDAVREPRGPLWR